MRQRRQLRELVDPGERLDGLDDELGMGGDAAFLGFGRDARIERGTPGIADDVGLLGRLAARRYRPHNVGEVGRVDVVVHHHHEAPHIGVGGSDQRGALGVAVVALPERYYGHQLRYMLPHADYVGDAGGFEIAPDAGGAQRQAEMEARRLHGRRAEQNRIVAVMDGGNLHDRTGALVRREIAGELAERAFRQGNFADGKQVPFENDFRVGRYRQAGDGAGMDFDRRVLDGAGEIVFGDAGREIFEARDKQRRVFAIDYRNRAGFAALPIFSCDDGAMPAAVVELDGDPVRSMHLHTVDRGVDPAALGIAHDDEAAGPDIGAAVLLVPDRCRKSGEVHVAAAPGIFHERRVCDCDGLTRHQGPALCHPGLQSIERAQQRVDAERQRGALRARHRIRYDAEAERIAFDAVEQQRRTLRHAGCDLRDGADLVMRVRTLDAPQRLEGIDLGNEFAKVSVRHCGNPAFELDGYLLCCHRPASPGDPVTTDCGYWIARRSRAVTPQGQSGRKMLYAVTASFAFHSWPSAVLAGKISDLITTGTAPELSSISPMSMKSNCFSSSPSMEITGLASFISARK